MKRLISVVLILAVVMSLFTVVPAQAAESWLWPTSKNAVITSSYGARNGKNHNGLDIGGTHGKSPIYASKSGTVVASYSGCTCRSDYSSKSEYYNGSTCRHGKTLGNYVIINHGDGVYTRYMHLYWKGVAAVGTKVSQGDIIGYIGSTGRSSGVHLHFEIKTGGTGVSGGTILNGTYVNTNKSNISYVYTPGASAGETVTPPVHTHSYSYSNDSSHPHSEYKYCSCGDKEYTGKKKLISSCSSCYPVGSVKLTREFEKTKGTATFYRNNVNNAASYTLKLYKNNSLYNTYNMSSDKYYVSGLPSGEYYAILYAKNSSTGEERSDSCPGFKIADTYTVSYNANGGTGAPSSQTKIEDTTLTLASKIPTKEGHVFKGWASSRNAIEAQYQAGGSYTKNAKITLYAVWEPEIYTVTFDVNGGIGSVESETVTYGNTIKMPNSIVKEYAYLRGWSTDKNATAPEYALGLDHKIKSNLTLYAVWGDATWNSEVSASVDGKGTEEEPYLISTAADLAYVANKINTQTAAPSYEYYKLTDNINLTYTEWIPIGVYNNENQYFYGSFDGNGYTISDLYITAENQGHVGLFGYVKDSEIKNLTLTGAIESVSSAAALSIGGIVGYASNSSLADLSSKYFNIGSIAVGTADYSSVGAIVGKTAGGSIEKCESYNCSINIKSGMFYTGMIAGYCDSDITDCSVESTEEGLFSTSAAVGSFYMGGLCGALTKTAEKCSVKAPYFSNNLKTTAESSVGGLVGQLDGTAKVCSVQLTDSDENSITSTGTGSVNIGGFTGKTASTAQITDCKFDGKSISGATTSGNTYVGGLVGNATAKTNPTVSVSGGQSLSYASLPKRDGHKATWYIDSDYTTLYDFSQVVTSDLTLYAKWEEGEDTPDIWDGTSKEPSYNAETKTYTITNGEELAWVSDVTNGVITSGTNFPTNISFSGYTIELANDIYLNDISDWENWETTAPKNIWKPIGKSESYSSVFSGGFVGNNYCVYGMFIDTEKLPNSYMYRYAGLIGFATNSTIKNVKIKDVYITSYYDIGAIAGNLNGNVEDCNVVSGKIICLNSGSGDSSYIGGIVGRLNGGNISDSSNSVVISGVNSICGGIVGYVSSSSSSIDTCFNTANLTSGVVGGIVGSSYGEISKCYNEGNITYARSSASAGGIVGNLYSGAKIQYCYNKGNVTADYYTGGIAGNVTSSNISYCYNVGNITTKYADSYGGIAGLANGYSSAVILNYCYSTYSPLYDTSTEDNISASYVSYKSSSNMKSLSNLTGFSTSTWTTNSSINDGYPYLIDLAETYKTYKITTIVDEDNSAINRAFSNVDGDVSGSANLNSYAGGVIGYGYGPANAASVSKNMVGMVDNISSTTSGSSYKAYSGNIIGYNNGSKFSFENAYYNTEMNVESSTSTVDATGTARSSKTMNVAFYTNLLGLTPYTSLDNLDTDSSAVWVLKNAELPELYYNCLNDITISEDIENGVITVDKTQAVDGEIVTVTTTPNENYVLNKIYVNGEEIAGTTFEMSGACEVFATFAEKIAEYEISITDDENADGTLTNVDSTEPMVMLLSGDTNNSIIASDGEEILVSTTADTDYTVDSIYVNGEEIAGDSFILTENSVVTMEVASISTDVVATTNDAEDVGSYFAVVSGSVSGDTEGIGRYVRYWSADDTETIYTTDVESGAGECTVELMDLDAETTYYYQMTEFGEIKSFTTCAEPVDEHTGDEDGGYDTEESYPLTATTYSKTQEGYEFNIECSQVLTSELLYAAVYDTYGRLIDLKAPELNEGSSYTASFSLDTDIAYAKIFVWSSLSSLVPTADAEIVYITE